MISLFINFLVMGLENLFHRMFENHQTSKFYGWYVLMFYIIYINHFNLYFYNHNKAAYAWVSNVSNCH